MFVHSADKLAEMRTKFRVKQAKLIMSVWCFTVHCAHLLLAVLRYGHGALLLPDAGLQRVPDHRQRLLGAGEGGLVQGLDLQLLTRGQGGGGGRL